MFSKITKLNDYDKVTLIYEPTVQAKKQQSKVLAYLTILVSIAIFLLGVNFAFHFLRYTTLLPPSPTNHQQSKNGDIMVPFKINDCPEPDFDYLQLTIRWPPSFCNYESCRKDVKMDNWLIHGLWPDFNNGSYPQFCCNERKFDINELKSLRPELELYWKDLKNEDSEFALLKHEWNKHGTCTMINPKSLGTVFNYFNTTIELFKKYEVQKWLEENDIVPNATKPYELFKIKNVIESKFNGKKIKIECDKYTHEKENCDKADYSNGEAKNCSKIKSKVFKLIDSIDLCFDKMNLEPINCPLDKKPRKITCDEEVYYFRDKKDLENLKF